MKHSLILVMAFAVTASACSTGTDSAAATTTISPSVTLTTDTLTGTVPVGGSDAHNIVLSQTGELDVTLTAAGPPSTIFMGLGIGTLSGSGCVFLSGATTNVQAGASPQLSGSAVAAGTYCVAVYDIGNEAAPITYSLTVVHS